MATHPQAARGGVHKDDVTSHGRAVDFDENAALNSSSFDNKIFYMYREVVISLLISYPQDDVSYFLFNNKYKIKTNDAGLDKMFSKNGEIDQSTFDKVVWFLYNAKNYVNTENVDDFYSQYPQGGFLNSINNNNFVIKVASESLSLTLCRYLFTIFKTIQARKIEGTQGGGGGAYSTPVAVHNTPENTFIAKTIEWIKATFSPLKGALGTFYTTKVQSIHADREIQHSIDIITENCDKFEKTLFADTAPFDDDGNPIAVEAVENYNTILENQQTRSVNIPIDRIAMNSNDRTVLHHTRQQLEATGTTTAPRSCSRLVAKKEAAAAAAADAAAKAAADRKRKEEARLQLIIETKNQLDQALKAAGTDYAGIKIIPRKYFSKESDAEFRITTDDATFLLYLAKTLCAIMKGSFTMMSNPNSINNKCAVTGLLGRLGLCPRSVIANKINNGEEEDEEEDEEEAELGGGLRQKGGGVELMLPNGFHPIGLRSALEGIGAAVQCFKGVGAIKDIPRIRCYICGELWLPDQKTMECEHIFCVGLAAQYFGLLRSTAFSDEQRLVLSILYAWAHRCCNQLKSNISFMQFKTPPAQGFQFHEHNARELLNNIYGNKKYDCNSVYTSIKKNFKTKPPFTDARTRVLGRYCKPLISEINAVRERIFFNNTQLFAFMGILKIATTALVLFTGSDANSLAIKSKDMIGLLGLFNPELEVSSKANSATASKKRKPTKKGKGLIGGGDREYKSSQSGGGLLDQVEFSSDKNELTEKYVTCLISLLKWDIEHHRVHPRVLKIMPHSLRSFTGEVPAAAVAAERAVTVWVTFENKSTGRVLGPVIEVPVSTTSDDFNAILRLLEDRSEEVPNYSLFVNGESLTSGENSFIEILGRQQLSSETVIPIGFCPESSAFCAGSAERSAGKPQVSDQSEQEPVFNVDKNGDPPLPPDYGDVYPPPPPHDAPAPAGHDLDGFVFNLLAHTHEMNTHTILNALVFDANEDHKNQLKLAIATITNSFLTRDDLAITKRQASVLQLLILTRVNIGPFTALVQRTIDDLLTPDEIYNPVTQAVCIDATRTNDRLTVDEGKDLKRVCLALYPGEIPDQAGENTELLFKKFLSEIHQDIFLFLTHCRSISPRFASLLAKINVPVKSNTPVDRKFDFQPQPNLHTRPEPAYYAHNDMIRTRIHRLCEIVGQVFSDPFLELNFDGAKGELLDGLVGLLPYQDGETGATQRDRLSLELMYIRKRIDTWVNDILDIESSKNDVDFRGNVQICMTTLVKPFLKVAFAVDTEVPPVVPVNLRSESSGESDMGAGMSESVPRSVSESKKSELSSGESDMGAGALESQNTDAGGPSQVSDSFQNSPPFGLSQESQQQNYRESVAARPTSMSVGPAGQLHVEPVSENTVTDILLILIADIQRNTSEIFNDRDDTSNSIIDNICAVWSRRMPDPNSEIIFIPRLMALGHDGGRKKKSSIRTRRKLGRNHRRTQHTNKRKHKRSSSKHATIKHRKSYRKHHRTIKRRKNSRRRN